MQNREFFFSMIKDINVCRESIRDFLLMQSKKYKTEDNKNLIKNVANELDEWPGEDWDDRFDYLRNEYIKSDKTVQNSLNATIDYIDAQRSAIKDVLIKYIDISNENNSNSQKEMVICIAKVMDEDHGKYWDELFDQIKDLFNIGVKKCLE